MKKFCLLIILSCFQIHFLYSQESLLKAPKQMSVEFGLRGITSTNFSAKPSLGGTVLFDYAWQLSGFNSKRRASYITVPIGYSILSNSVDSMSSSTSILSYGWTVRHNLAVNKKIIPFIGYGLLLNQLRFEGVDGSVFGHQTRFDFGIDFLTEKRLIYFTKLEYSTTRFPKLGDKKSNSIGAVEFKLGFRF